MVEIFMSKSNQKSDIDIGYNNNGHPLEGFIDTHIHTAPDIKPRLLSDVEAAVYAQKERMHGIVIKSHVESTVGRATLTSKVTGLPVWGGLTLNENIGGLNPQAVENMALMGGKIVWFPTISAPQIKMDIDKIESILSLIAEYDLVLATGHLKPANILSILDVVRDMHIKRVIINHPLSQVVGATIDEQREMAKKAYLEHCYVATQLQHDGLDSSCIAQSIKEIGPTKCILATDLGQAHNPPPHRGLKMFIREMMLEGISKKQIKVMCADNPAKILL